MNFREALDTVELVLMTGEVPLLIGESGIGKTSLVRELCNKNEYYLVNIDGNLLKEGEIGGLPVVDDVELYQNGRKVIRKATKYATHSKLLQIDEAIEKGHEKILLFIDELNRCEHAVQQELMNIILNREINGYKLADEVSIIGAMNPSNKYDNYEESDYQVVDMDPAQEDRFVWIDIESDIKQWIGWAMGQGQIHEYIVEFISTFPEYLHTPNSRETIKATPRSWERVSKAYKVFENSSKNFSFDTLYNAIKGNVGATIAQDFVSYVKNIKKPIIKSEEIFKEKVISFDIKESIKKENHSRLYIIAKNCINYIESNNGTDEEVTILSDLLSCYPKDLRLGIMKEIKSDCSKEIYEKFLDNDKFLEIFFDIYS